MKAILKKIEENLTDAALLEMGIGIEFTPRNLRQPFTEALEEHLVEIAYAEAADYDQIHDALRREHDRNDEPVHRDECQYGDNDVCFAK